MCEHGVTTRVPVTMPARLSHTGEDRPFEASIDSCIAPIVAALNAAGIRTDASCCGHGTGPGSTITNWRGRLMCDQCSTAFMPTAASETSAPHDYEKVARWRCVACREEFNQIPAHHVCKGPSWSP